MSKCSGEPNKRDPSLVPDGGAYNYKNIDPKEFSQQSGSPHSRALVFGLCIIVASPLLALGLHWAVQVLQTH